MKYILKRKRPIQYSAYNLKTLELNTFEFFRIAMTDNPNCSLSVSISNLQTYLHIRKIASINW